MLVGEARIPDAMRVYAIGDIHGCLDLLQELFSLISDDLAASPCVHHKIITIGDYCDRGPNTRGVIDFLIEKQKSGNTICICGNHDQRMLEFPDMADEIGESFLHYGGRQTLASYGVDPDGYDTFGQLAKAFKRALPSAHMKFLDNLPLMYEEGDYVFAHAGIRPGVDLSEQSPKDLLWIRELFLQHQGAHEKVVVHGHTIHDIFDIQPNRINLDTGAFQSGILSCAVLEKNEVRLIQAVQPFNAG